MTVVRITRAAREDLRNTADWIAQHNPEASFRFLQAIRQRLTMIGDQPRVGREREDLAPGLRGLVHGRQLILYRVDTDGVLIVRVLDGRRDLFELFKD